MKRVLVTGGAGFLGSHLCERLLREGNHVVCLDNYHTGSRDNVAALCASSRFRSIEQDVMDPIQVEVDEIYNLASPASPTSYQADPIWTMKTSVLGALSVLDLAQRTGAKVLQASTSEIYGDPAVHPQPESYWGNVNPIGIRSCYDEGKRAAETLFFDYRRARGVRTKIVRIFNTYGPRMHPSDGRVVSNFIMQALRGEPITIYGAGTQTRSFCYVDDLVEALQRMMATDDDFVGPINVGNPVEFTMIELARRIVGLTGSDSELAFVPLPPDDPRQRQPDIALARQMLGGWTPRVGLEEGLSRTIAYFRKLD